VTSQLLGLNMNLIEQYISKNNLEAVEQVVKAWERSGKERGFEHRTRCTHGVSYRFKI
jgi:hypothetical protein